MKINNKFINTIFATLSISSILFFSGCKATYVDNLDDNITDYSVVEEIDLNEVTEKIIDDYHFDDKKVSCKVSISTLQYQDYDFRDFFEEDIGKAVEYDNKRSWLNIKSSSVNATMKDRIKRAYDYKCDIVLFTDVDIYNFDSGFINTTKDAENYVSGLIEEAHYYDLQVAAKDIDVFDNNELKNKFDLISYNDEELE